MESLELFNILGSVDSTNNYAMAQVHAGLAKEGMAWFAHEQTEGKGQQGKKWESRANQNLLLSIVIMPRKVFFQKQFYFNAVIASTCRDFLSSYAGNEISIKWPNDIYWRDRKAGGILIENILMGMNWKWAVVGIGLNINQSVFENTLVNPVSLTQITGRSFDPLILARELYELVLSVLEKVTEEDFPDILIQYNNRLYKKGQITRLKKDNIVFETYIRAVNGSGQLITEDAVERHFNFGEVEWLRE